MSTRATTLPGPHRPLVPVALAAATATLLGSRALRGTHWARARLERTNYHGRTVSLRGGLGVALGSVSAPTAGAVLDDAARPGTALPAVAGAVAASAGALAGLVDDLDAGAHDGGTPVKGLRGHLGALRRGRVTTGALKIAVIGGGAAAAGSLLAAWRRFERVPTAAPSAPGAVTDAVTSAVVIASWANVHNLLDLRPGRALKAAALLSVPLTVAPGPGAAACRALATGALATSVSALPEDLRESTMLGDVGSNALGALVGTALAAHPAAGLRVLAAGLGTGLVLASEKVSFSTVIARTPVLNALDTLGRRAR
ncbi:MULTISPECIES: hypothetical protein [Actinomyces]|uniref:Glycosyl transferase family 4 n=1 Tax=Actinomyces respiraculi TaxID=2744574 RepID=A0A7T0LMH6_9ACTO|nr:MULTISPECIES: hypothetical protein [Actinomyces]QPL06327.1 hypothetical protein ID810_05385 [Actinomyces respiraculi]